MLIVIHVSELIYNELTGFLKTFLFCNNFRITDACQDSTESSFIHFMQLPLMLTTYRKHGTCVRTKKLTLLQHYQLNNIFYLHVTIFPLIFFSCSSSQLCCILLSRLLRLFWSVCWRRSLRGCDRWLMLELDSGNWRLLTPIPGLGMYVLLTVPQLEPFSRTQA